MFRKQPWLWSLGDFHRAKSKNTNPSSIVSTSSFRHLNTAAALNTEVNENNINEKTYGSPAAEIIQQNASNEEDYLNETQTITQGDRLNAIKAVRRINQLHNPHHQHHTALISTSVPVSQNRSALNTRSSTDLANSLSMSASSTAINNNNIHQTSNYRLF